MDKDKIVEITSRLQTQHNIIVERIEQFPETIYVGRCRNGIYAKITYPKTGLGLACFLSKKDSETWFSTPDKGSLELVEMTKDDAVKLAKKHRLRYLHLLSSNVNEPLNHYKIL